MGARYGLLVLFLSAAVFYDYTSRKIPNALILIGTGIAALCQIFLSDGLGPITCLKGLGLGLILLLPFYVVKVMGAGDVKLMAMTGAFLGPSQVVGAVLGTFLAGLFLGLAFASRARTLTRLLSNLKFMLFGGILRIAGGQILKLEEPPISAGEMPYAIAIAFGTLGYLILPWIKQAFL